MNKAPVTQPELKLENTEVLSCKNCGSTNFAQGVQLRRVSAIASPTGQEGVIPLPQFYCVECKTIISDESDEE